MHIFLVRHGESIANIGQNYEKRLPDHLVELSDRGKGQAYEAGVFFSKYCKEKNISLENARIWRSPYMRTRQTSEEFNKSLHISDIKEDIALIEQRFGLFDSVPKEEWEKVFPKAYEEYNRQRNNYGKFYAKLPMGDSPYDVAIRVHGFMGTIYRDLDKHNIDTLIIFTHGTTLRAFLLTYLHYSPEWFQNERNPKNCWIREINDNKDLGYINA